MCESVSSHSTTHIQIQGPIKHKPRFGPWRASSSHAPVLLLLPFLQPALLPLVAGARGLPRRQCLDCPHLLQPRRVLARSRGSSQASFRIRVSVSALCVRESMSFSGGPPHFPHTRSPLTHLSYPSSGIIGQVPSHSTHT
jgi:hypothetical protein